MSSIRQQHLLLAAFLTVLPAFVQGYSFQLLDQPTQCGNATFQITGSGSPPYSLLLVPYGPPSTSTGVEVRHLQNLQFDSGATTLSIQFKYPANSQFVAVVSDSTGFGTGGTGVATTVSDSSDSSCYNPNQQVEAPAFAYSIVPSGQLVQCTPTRIWWDPTKVQGTPKFQGVIPGGQSFEVPQGSITTVPEQGTGFSWTPSIRAGSTVMLVGGDDRGTGNAGSSFYIVSQNVTTNDSSCINNNSPSSTPGTPAGAMHPTGTTNVPSGGSGTPVGAIVGGVVGGLAGLVAIALAFIFYMRRRRFQRANKERPALFQDNDDDGPSERRENLPHYYEPEPFTLPEPTDAGSTRASTDNRRHSELTYMTDLGFGAQRAGTPDGGTVLTGSSRKSPLPTLRPVNVIQHEDAGPSGGPGEEDAETVELPPAYTNLRK